MSAADNHYTPRRNQPYEGYIDEFGDERQAVGGGEVLQVEDYDRPLPPCPICGKTDLFIGTDGKPGCPHCEVAVVIQ